MGNFGNGNVFLITGSSLYQSSLYRDFIEVLKKDRPLNDITQYDKTVLHMNKLDTGGLFGM